jgi:carbon-monoxide dehydrogenase small subunit
MTEFELDVNGETHAVDVDPAKPLAAVLREDLGLTGTKQGCSTGVCGACTVQIDGEARKACMHMVGVVADREIRTVEGLADGEDLHPVQEGFVEEFGLQCGFCTPGFVMSAAALLEENPDPSEAEIKEAIHGNTCRCTGYTKIIDSIEYAADAVDGEDGDVTAHSD